MALLLALIALALLALTGALGSAQGGVLIMFPALLLAVMMLTRPYIGQHVIARLAGRRPRRAAVAGTMPTRLRRRAVVARGGRLLAGALAGRAPPTALAGRC